MRVNSVFNDVLPGVLELLLETAYDLIIPIASLLGFDEEVHSIFRAKHRTDVKTLICQSDSRLKTPFLSADSETCTFARLEEPIAPEATPSSIIEATAPH